MGLRSSTNFNRTIDGTSEIFKNINEKLKDLPNFVNNLKLESQEIDLRELL